MIIRKNVRILSSFTSTKLFPLGQSVTGSQLTPGVTATSGFPENYPENYVDYSTLVSERNSIYPSPATINVKSYGAYGDDSHDDTTAINNAISAASAGDKIYFPSGTYKVTGTISITKPLILYGDGPGISVIKHYANDACIYIAGNATDYYSVLTSGQDPSGIIRAIGSNCGNGSDTVILSDNPSYYQVGGLVLIDQTNDGVERTSVGSDGQVRTWIGYGTSGGIYGGGNFDGSRAYNCYALITAKNGYELTLDRKIYYPITTTYYPRTIIISNSVLKYVGLENLTLTKVSGYTDDIIRSYRAVKSWIYKCEISNVYNQGIELAASNYRWVIKKCYIHGCQYRAPSAGYGILINLASSITIEDNIFYDLRSPCAYQTGGEGNTCLYNYFVDCNFDDSNSYFRCGPSAHASYSHGILFEGNDCGRFLLDDYHGSNGKNIYFRNWARGKYDTLSEASYGYYLVEFNRNSYGNMVCGNVLGHNSYGQKYRLEQGDNQSTKVYYNLGLQDGMPDRAYDSNVLPSTVRHGNYLWGLYNTTEWDENYGQNLPDSLVYNSKPAFFGNLDFPAFGPDISGYVRPIPAYNRWETYKVSQNISDLFTGV